MRWQQRVRVATGLSCWQIVLHLLVVALLVMGWMSGTLVRVGLGLCVVYGVTVLLMLALQRHHEQRWRDVADVLEELTTTWYFGAAMIVLWLLSRVLQNNVLLALAGLGVLAGPALVSLPAEDKKLQHPSSKNPVTRLTGGGAPPPTQTPTPPHTTQTPTPPANPLYPAR